jgi:large subunit ribosomal protein L32e
MNTENTIVTPAKHANMKMAKENTSEKALSTSAVNTHAHAQQAQGHEHAHVSKENTPKVEAKVEAKAETKTSKTTSAKTSAKKESQKKEHASNKPVKKKGVKAAWVKKEKVTKTNEVKDTQNELIQKWKPTFWGRFGKKNLRTRKNPKYDKWRKPRGEDMLLRKDDGMIVQSGYRTPRSIRGMHPSGYEEVLIQSARDFNSVKKNQAARISGTIGRKKKIALIKLANEKKIPVLN